MLRRPHHTIEANAVHVWRLLADDLRDPAVQEAMRAFMSAQEISRMKAYAHERDRTLFVLSRGLMRSVLGSYLQMEFCDLQFNVTPHGKPILESAQLHFNLTHSRGAVALAVSCDREVGVDVEERSRKVDYLGLAERYFSRDESQYLATLSADQQAEAFFTIWTLKEAYVKGIGRGLTFPLDVFAFDLEVNRLIAFRALADFVSSDWHFHQFDMGERHCGAVAVQGEGTRIELRDWASVFLDGALAE